MDKSCSKCQCRNCINPNCPAPCNEQDWVPCGSPVIKYCVDKEGYYKKGDSIYYHHKNGDTYPGNVLGMRVKWIKIIYNGLYNDVVAWVKIKNISSNSNQ